MTDGAQSGTAAPPETADSGDLTSAAEGRSGLLRTIAGARPAFWTFVTVEVVAFVVYLYLGRHLWFAFDEWDFLAGRGLNVEDLLRSHGGHLVAVPVAVYRALFFAFGLRAYVPYLLVVVVLHLVAAALLRVLMRRCGVHPWLATLAASLFALLGSGSGDVLWGFQVTFTGALTFGLVQLVLADHDGSIDWRDWLGLGAGLISLACAGVGVTMVLVVGIAALLRRGWRAAAFHVLPLALLYLAWWTAYEPAQSTSRDPELILRWLWRGLTATFDGMGQVPVVPLILAAMLVAGFVVAWQTCEPAERRRRASIPVASLIGAVAFIVITGLGRVSLGVGAAASSRYVHIGAALLLVPLAVAGDALWRRYRVLAPVVALVFIVGIPGNIADMDSQVLPAASYASLKQNILAAPRQPLARSVPASLRPFPAAAPQVTIGWLLEGVRAGRVPEPPRTSTPLEKSDLQLALSLQQLNRGSTRHCKALTHPITVKLADGGELLVRGSVAVQPLGTDGRPTSPPKGFGASFLDGANDHTLVAVAGPMTLLVTPQTPNSAACPA